MQLRDRLRIYASGLGTFALALLVVGGVLAKAANDREELTAVDKLRVENRDLKKQLAEATATADQCAGELGQIRTTMNRLALERADAELKTAIEQAHPGFTWNAKTRTLEPAKGAP